MALTPGYGETPVPDEELDSLVDGVRAILGEPITRAAVYDVEQAVQEEVAEELVIAALDGILTLPDLLTDAFLRDLHRRLYGDIWLWAGQYRRREVNIGVAPTQIAVELRGSLETLHYRWQHAHDGTARELGIAAHAEGVRIHPFTDGNGRATRLHADLVFLAAQDGGPGEIYDWQFDKRT